MVLNMLFNYLSLKPAIIEMERKTNYSIGMYQNASFGELVGRAELHGWFIFIGFNLLFFFLKQKFDFSNQGFLIFSDLWNGI